MVFVLAGCSVGMALKGTPEPQLGSLAIGQNRSIVLLNLGQPAKTLVEPGKRIDIFHLERGNEPSTGRAVAHALADVLTYGAWEIIGTGVEAFQGEKFTLTVEYDGDDSVSRVITGKLKGGFE
jgi:hypothetical protein